MSEFVVGIEGGSGNLKLIPIRQRKLDLLPAPIRTALTSRPLLLLALGVQRDIRRLLLDQPDHLLLRAGVEDVAGLAQQQLHVLRHVAPGHVDAADAARHGEAFVDWHGVRDAVAGVQHDACCAAGGVEGEDRLDGGEEGGHVEGFEKDLRRDVSVCAWVEGRFG